MKNHNLIAYNNNNFSNISNDFNEAILFSRLIYSLSHLNFSENTVDKNVLEALRKSIEICQLAGHESKHHFKKIYVFNPELNTLQSDYRLSKNGLNMMAIQFSLLTKNKASWLWNLTNI